MKLSVVVPAYNEEQNIGGCLAELSGALRAHGIPYEIIVVDDNSQDGTGRVVREAMQRDPCVRLVERRPPSGFGRAVRAGLLAVEGDVVVLYMADRSDDPQDVLTYYRKIEEGYDCVFGSRFIKGATVQNYPPLKLLVNRIVNKCIQLLFWTGFNDLTNAFKAYRVNVIRDCGPYHASHFNITVEMSLSALIRRYNIVQIPIRWYGRTWGDSNLKLRQMGRRYLEVVLMLFFQRWLVVDDLIADRLARSAAYHGDLADLEARLSRLEARLVVEGGPSGAPPGGGGAQDPGEARAAGGGRAAGEGAGAAPAEERRE